MAVVKFFASLSIVFAVTLSLACGGPAKNSSNTSSSASKTNDNANAARSNIEELRLIANIPYEAEDIAWKEDKANKKVVAVLRFSPADSIKVVAEAERIKPAETANISSAPWFPPELIAQSEMSGDDNLRGKAYPANQFFLEQYTSGRIIRIENTDYFVLELTVKE